VHETYPVPRLVEKIFDIDGQLKHPREELHVKQLGSQRSK
jgi:hypothetical protein